MFRPRPASPSPSRSHWLLCFRLGLCLASACFPPCRASSSSGAAVALLLSCHEAGAEQAMAHAAVRAGRCRARSVRAVDVSSVRASAAWTSANRWTGELYHF